MVAKRLILTAVVLLAVVPIYAQHFPTAPGNETTHSYGVFKIKVEPPFASLFTGCPGFSGGVLTSPILYDPSTKIGVSAAGSTPTRDLIDPARTIAPGDFFHPREPFPIPTHAGVYMQMRELHMTDSISTGTGVAVSVAPDSEHISPGAVVPAPASPNSFFQMFVHINLPHCGGLPAATELYNKSPNEPLVVKATLPATASLPPTGIVYVHDETNVVPIRFYTDNPGHWKKDQVLGCIVFAGHGVTTTREAEKPGSARFEKQAAALAHGHTAKDCGHGRGIGVKPGSATNLLPEFTNSDTSPESSRTEAR
ncbi:MAG TPA: hypothetical protein VFQ41_01860 [Candidatus Angelobacter sp.]|nr:hypothetical protein [Candidatus Angelobacter sp.]